jgi:hypothetical protein
MIFSAVPCLQTGLRRTIVGAGLSHFGAGSMDLASQMPIHTNFLKIKIKYQLVKIIYGWLNQTHPVASSKKAS